MKGLLRGVYAALPFKRQVFGVIRRFWRVPERVYRHLHFTGTFRVDVGPQSSFLMRHYGYQIENELFWTGLEGWERESLKLWRALCHDASVILDVGANTGMYALVARVENPRARILAFEMIDAIHERLLANVGLNRFDITCVRAAISDRRGTATYFQPISAEAHSYGLGLGDTTGEAEAGRDVEVPTTTLSAVIEEHRLPTVDLVKLDIEGHEPEAMRGFGEYLARFKPTLLVEVLSQARADQLNALVRGLGYLSFDIDEHRGVTPTSRIGPSSTYNVLLCSAVTARRLGLPAETALAS
jgi:FkbM family methyltransferase